MAKEIRPLSNDDIDIAQGFLNPIVFFNVFMPGVEKRVEISRDYQDQILLDRQTSLVVQSGRGIGKTTVLESDILQVGVTSPNTEALLTTPNKAHLDPLFNRVVNFCENDPLFKDFLVTSRKSPEYQMIFKNGFVLYGRIAGTGTKMQRGSGLLSLHVIATWIDESQLYLGQALEQLQGCLLPGCRIRVFGVPNGLQNSLLVKTREDTAIPSFSKYKISRYMDPTFTVKEEERLARMYSGKNSVQFKNQVLGEDDVVQQSTFSPRFFTPCFKQYNDYEIIEIDGTRIDENKINYISDLPIPVDHPETILTRISADIGYDPDPSIIGIWNVLGNGISRLVQKIILRSISFTRQAKILDYIANNIESTQTVSMDVGGPGRSIYLDLINQEMFPNKKYTPVAVNFGASIPVAVEEKDGKEEITKEPIKYWSTVLLQKSFQKHSIELPEEDLDIYNDVHSSTQSKTSEGRYTYSGPDHNLDMIRVFEITPLLAEDITNPKTTGDVLAFADF